MNSDCYKSPVYNTMDCEFYLKGLGGYDLCRYRIVKEGAKETMYCCMDKKCTLIVKNKPE